MKKVVSNEGDLDMNGTSFWLPMYVKERDYRRDLLSEYRTTVDDEKGRSTKKSSSYVLDLSIRIVIA